MKIYYVETGYGCTLLEASDSDHAYNLALREAGTRAGVSKVREAFRDDIAWVRAMSGRVPLVEEA